MSTKMTRDVLLSTAKSIADKAGESVSKVELDRHLGYLSDAIKAGLAEGMSVALPEIGTFKVSARGPSTGRNPQTGEAVAVPARAVVSFTASKNIKETLKAAGTIDKLV